MISNEELIALIVKARAAGATVETQVDLELMLDEGRQVVEAVRVEGVKGIGPNWMSAITAGERLRSAGF